MELLSQDASHFPTNSRLTHRELVHVQNNRHKHYRISDTMHVDIDTHQLHHCQSSNTLHKYCIFCLAVLIGLSSSSPNRSNLDDMADIASSDTALPHSPESSTYPYTEPDQSSPCPPSYSSSLCSLLHSPVTSSLFGPDILLSTLFSNTLSLCSALNVRDQVSHPYKTTGTIIVLYILTFVFMDSKLEDKRFCTE